MDSGKCPPLPKISVCCLGVGMVPTCELMPQLYAYGHGGEARPEAGPWSEGGSSMTRMPRLFPAFLGGPGAVGNLVLRLVAGTAMRLHGWPKIQQATSWMGPDARVPGVV